MEIWKDVNGFSNYEVSSYGRVRNKFTNTIKKARVSNHGYYITDLFEKGKGSTKLIHRLVALHFINNPENKETVNHIDGNKLNNDLSNLEWNTFSEQNIHFYANGLKSRENINKAVKAMNEASSRKVRCKNDGRVFPSISEASRQVGTTDGNICRTLRGKGKSAGKDKDGNPLYWEYLN